VRVLHVCESFGGGVFTLVKELCNAHVGSGISVGVAYALREETPPNFSQQLDHRIQLYDLNEGRSPGRGGQVTIEPWHDLRALVEVVRVLVEFRPDVVHTHSSKAGFLGRVAGVIYRFLGHRTRVFYSPHGFAFLRADMGASSRYLFLLLEKVAYMAGGMVVGCSASEAQVARDRIGRKRVAVIDNAVDLGKVPLLRTRESHRSPRVVTLGRISPQKDPGLFSEVAQRVSERGVRFVWIGGGSAENEALLRSNPNVTVTGWVPREEALDKLTEGDVYLQTSRWEGMPLAVIEAMAAGLPTVVTDIVGNRDLVVHGKTGYIGRTAEELAQWVEHLCADVALRRALGQQAREIALERFALPRFLREWQLAYEGHITEIACIATAG
jgi:glycosyltransferase involved in cell wall biosynthesis